MSRYAYNGVVRTQQGGIVASATVNVYEADTTTTVTMYEAKSGGVAVTSLTTGSDGSFLFYLDDNDYFSGYQCDIVVSKTGHLGQTKYDVHVF